MSEASGYLVDLDEDTVAAVRAVLPRVAERTVSGITATVPSYADALAGPMGETIRGAVETALGGFVQLAARGEEAPTAPALEGAYQLGRGEARSGRTVDALLTAYRIGARISWRELSEAAVASGVDAETLGQFAGLVFAYIEQLSAASLAGHTDELQKTGRVRQRLLERLGAALLEGSSPETVTAAAEAAQWQLPTTLTVVLAREAQVRTVLSRLPGETLEAAADPDGDVVLLVPDVDEARRRRRLLRSLADLDVVVGPARPWERVRGSHERARRVQALPDGPSAEAAGSPRSADSEEHLVELVLTADPDALADLRARALEPLAQVRDSSAEKLVETLRSWLRHQGRREAVAEELFVHPQTVRYRMGRLRELYGERLEDPDTLLELTVALAIAPDDPD